MSTAVAATATVPTAKTKVAPSRRSQTQGDRYLLVNKVYGPPDMFRVTSNLKNFKASFKQFDGKSLDEVFTTGDFDITPRILEADLTILKSSYRFIGVEAQSSLIQDEINCLTQIEKTWVFAYEFKGKKWTLKTVGLLSELV